eukprot:g7474.t1
MRSSFRSGGILVPRNECQVRKLQVANSSPAARDSTSSTYDITVLNKYHALLLDGSFRPLAILNWHRALTLDLFRSVEVLEYYDCFVQTVREAYPIPAVLRSDFIRKKIASVKIPVTRRNVLRRDRFSCVYCGVTQNLTVDHVIPISKGGTNHWENVVTACRSCNNRKGNRTLEQIGWKLKTKPRRPGAYDFYRSLNWPQNHPEEWNDYIGPPKDVQINQLP